MTADTLAPSTALPAEQNLLAQTEAGTTTTTTITTFADLGVDPRAVAALARMSIETPTLIQARAIPPLLAGRDVIGQSRTGSGKTIAYGLPLIERIDPRLRRMQALVLVPTRELAGQVASVLLSLGASRGLRVAQLIGGRSYTPQREALRMGAQVAVGAPGRVLDHLRQGTLDLSHLTFAVLDEADQMLDAGFAPDVERLLSAMPEGRQLALFTATLPEMTTQIAQRHLREPVSVDAGTPESRPAPSITQVAYTVPREHRLNALMTLLDRRRNASGTTLVFGRTKHGVDKLARQLIARGYPVAALHGNMSQNARDRVLADFRSGKSPMLLATNVAARGLDVLSIEQVINYELPESAELFTHRVGRTGRMDNTGEAITLLTPDDMAAWRRFQRDLALKLKPQPWPVSELPASASVAAPAQPAEATNATEAVAPVSPAITDATPAPAERFSERYGERRPQRPTERYGERYGERRGERRPDRRFERSHERGDYERGVDPVEGERRPTRRSFGDESRPAAHRDGAPRWNRSGGERFGGERAAADGWNARHDRRDDRRDDYRDDHRESRFERGEDTRRDDRRDDRRAGRFSAERGERGERRDTRARDMRRGPARDEAQRPAGPRRSAGGYRAVEGGAPRRPAGRPIRARATRPARG